MGLARRRPLTSSPSATRLLGRLSARRDPDVESDPESMVLLQTDGVSSSLCVSSPSQWRGKTRSFFFFFFFLQRKKTHCSNKVLRRSKKLPKKDCILTGIMNEHKEIIQCSTNKIVFTYSMYCQWPITLQ